MKFASSSVSNCFVLSVYCLMLVSSMCSEAHPSPFAPNPAFFLTDGPNASHFQASFESIQQAINAAEENSSIYVAAGLFFEHIVVNKSLTLVGEADFASVIDGNSTGTVVEITADNAVIMGFKVQNSGYGWNNNGIYAHNADNLTIQGNHLHDTCHNIKIGFSNMSRVLDNIIDGTFRYPTMYGIRVENSTLSTVMGNNVSDCVAAIHLQNSSECAIARNYLYNNDQGIRFYSPCASNEAYENNVINCTYDGDIEIMLPNTTVQENSFFHNNFVNNTYGFINRISGNYWDNGYPSGGNYWSRYNGTDDYSGESHNETGKDGIGDTPYAVNDYESDQYPLIRPYEPVRNLQTGVGYFTIQSAIDDPQTLEGQSIFIDMGVYHENVVVNKTVALIGNGVDNTTIDADGSGTVVTVDADNVTIQGFTIQRSGLQFPPYGSDYGLLLDHCSNCTIRDNRLVQNRVGIYLFFSEGNILERNVVESNSANGICLWYSGGNRLRGNSMSANKYNFGVFGDTFATLNNVVDISNIVDRKPIRFIIDRTNDVLDETVGASTIYLLNCVNITIKNQVFSSNSHGVFCYNVSDSTISNITAWKSECGLSLQDSFNNRIYDMNCTDNWVGILLQRSRENEVKHNFAIGGEKAISLYEADNNAIEENTVAEAYFGIRVYSSSNNSFTHNNFIGNIEQANVVPLSYQNVWNSSLEGNFWNDYRGNDASIDGIGDDPYIIDSENTDNRPLLGMFYSLHVNLGQNSVEFSLVTNSTFVGCDYSQDSGAIKLTVNGTSNTTGFCRLVIPHELVAPDIQVIIDDGSTSVIAENLNLYDDGSARWIYFSYRHSTHEVTIIPEYPVYVLILAAWAVSALSTVRFREHKSTK